MTKEDFETGYGGAASHIRDDFNHIARGRKSVTLHLIRIILPHLKASIQFNLMSVLRVMGAGHTL